MNIISVPIASSPAGNLTRFPLGTEARSLEQAVSCAADIRACPTPCLGLEGSLVDDGVYGWYFS